MSNDHEHDMTIWYVTQHTFKDPMSIELRNFTTIESLLQHGSWIQPIASAKTKEAMTAAIPQTMSALAWTFSHVWHNFVSPRNM